MPQWTEPTLQKSGRLRAESLSLYLTRAVEGPERHGSRSRDLRGEVREACGSGPVRQSCLGRWTCSKSGLSNGKAIRRMCTVKI